MKINEIRLIMTTSAASYSTPKRPVNIARSSKIHHSQQSISIPGIPIFKYIPMS